MNPSHAREDYSDRTVSHLTDVSACEHSGWLMLNLYPERSPNKELKSYDAELVAANCEAIERTLTRFGATEVLGGWVNPGASAGLNLALLDVLDMLDRMSFKVYTRDPLTRLDNPRHPYPQGRPLPVRGPKVYFS